MQIGRRLSRPSNRSFSSHGRRLPGSWNGGCDKATPTAAAAAAAADQPASVRPPAAPSAPDVAPARAAKKPAACPTTVAGASASVADVKDGIALTIAAKDAVAAADIRERARGLASVSTPGAGRGGGGGGDGNGPGDGSGGGGGGGAPGVVAGWAAVPSSFAVSRSTFRTRATGRSSRCARRTRATSTGFANRCGAASRPTDGGARPIWRERRPIWREPGGRETARAPVLSAREPHAAGRSTRNVVPRPTSLSTSTAPPIDSTRCFTIARPSPVPPWSRERPASTR